MDIDMKFDSVEYHERRVQMKQIIKDAIHKHVADMITDSGFSVTTENLDMLVDICKDADRSYKDAVEALFAKKKEMGILPNDEDDDE